MQKKITPVWKNPVFFALLASLLYGALLFSSTEMVLSCDAKNYFDLGQLLASHGWQEYLAQGPSREPIYPLFVASSFKWGQALNLPPLKIQTFVQLLLLFMTQLLLAWILLRLRIRPWITALAVFYCGFSPAIVNSALSLYSEIAVYPLVLGIIISSYLAWLNLLESKTRKFILWAVILGLCATGATFVKGIFEMITPVFMLPFLVLFVKALSQKKFALVSRLALLFFSFGLIFFGSLHGYKALNLRINGNYTLTNRGPWALYGNLARRGQDMDSGRVLTALASLPGEQFCLRFRTPRQCTFWSFVESDNLAKTARDNLKKAEIFGSTADKMLVRQGIECLVKNPLQQAAFWILEGTKMIFWESTRIGYVIYPAWVDRIFSSFAVIFVFRFVTSALTVCGLFFALIVIWQERGKLFSLDDSNNGKSILLFLLLTMIAAYTSIHSFFFVLIRYAFPLVPLFLVLIAQMIQNLAFKEK